MKLLIKFFIAALVIFFAVDMDAQRYEYAPFAVDTATDADTLTFLIDKQFWDNVDVSCRINADSLSGSTAGDAWLQYSFLTNPSATDDWVNGDTVVINGVSTDAVATISNLKGVRARVYVITSGTQSTRVDCDCFAKRRE